MWNVLQNYAMVVVALKNRFGTEPERLLTFGEYAEES